MEGGLPELRVVDGGPRRCQRGDRVAGSTACSSRRHLPRSGLGQSSSTEPRAPWWRCTCSPTSKPARKSWWSCTECRRLSGCFCWERSEQGVEREDATRVSARLALYWSGSTLAIDFHRTADNSWGTKRPVGPNNPNSISHSVIRKN